MKVLLLILPGISFGLSIPSAPLLRVLETCVPTLPTLTITYTTPAKFMVTRIIMDHIAAALHHLWMSTCHLCLKMELSHQFVLMGVDMPKGHGCDCNQQAKEDWIRVVALLRLWGCDNGVSNVSLLAQQRGVLGGSEGAEQYANYSNYGSLIDNRNNR